MIAHPGLHLEVEGHTDSVGGDEYNQKLSENRARAVRDYLVQQGIPDERHRVARAGQDPACGHQ